MQYWAEARCQREAAPRAEVRRQRPSEDGVSLLEYVILVALVAMVSAGALIYLGQGSSSPAHVARKVAVATVLGGRQADPVQGTSTGTPVKAWCVSGEAGCTDPMRMNGQTETIHFWATGGTGPYNYALQGSVPPFMIPDWSNHEINVTPLDCSQDPGTYIISLVVTDSAGHTGQLNFTLSIVQGSMCPRR